MLFKPRGSITIFLCIILAVLIPLSCMLIDITRYSLAKKQAKTALKICTESVLATYDRQLKEQYGLFAICPRDVESMEKEIYELLSRNLNTESAVDGFTDLYEFKVLSVDAIPFYNYSEPFVLQQQVSEFMKYRAPVQIVQEFYEKVKVMMGLIKEGDMIERKMTLDKLMNDIRCDLVNIYCMINNELIKFNYIVDSSGNTLKDRTVSNITEYFKIAKIYIKSAHEPVSSIKEAREGYVAIYDDYIKAKEQCDNFRRKLDNLNDKLQSKRHRLADLKDTATEKEDGELNSSNSGMIESLESEIAKLEDEYDSVSGSYNAAYKIFEPLEKEITGYKNTIDEGLNHAVTNLINARISNDTASSELSILMGHVSDHLMYTADVIEIMDALIPKLSELEKESESLIKDADEYEGSVSDTVKGSLEVQLKSIKVETFTDVRDRLALNLQKLESWYQFINDYYLVLCNASSELEDIIKTAEEIKEKPNIKNKDYNGYNNYNNITSDFTVLKGNLSKLKALNQMETYYSIPVYQLEPKANSNEIKSFNKWFNARYLGKESKDEQTDDEAALNEVREGISEFAEEAATQENETGFLDGINGSLENISERFFNLPSIKGETSSEEALVKIGKAIIESGKNNMVNANPLEKPVKGLDTVNEKEKNFFDYEIERIKELLEIIKNVVSDGAESLIESLYMNEYIVSAFKCVTAVDGIEHDIGWGRPLDKTFLKQAEVEYILFGNKSEKENMECIKRSIFAIRLLFNLLHVYTDPDKVATALTLATAIAGWTIFGIPVVQNFILIAWAGVESYVDTDFLLKGKSVPLIKTSASWYLGADKAISRLKEILTKDIRNFVTEKIQSKVMQASEAVQETITGIINGKIDQAFAPFEKSLIDLVGEPGESAYTDMKGLLKNAVNEYISSIRFENLDSFTANLDTAVRNLIAGVSDNLKAYAPEKLSQFKSGLKEEIRKFIFESEQYKKLEDKLVKLGTDLLDKGINAAGDQVDRVLGITGKSVRNNITGRLIMMNYVDYLRLMLLAVPAETKALRTADLIQLNMQEAAENYEISIDKYNTYIFIKAELDFNAWFAPEWLFKNGDSGMISVEWSQGY
jgi:cellobiose-specific phosphotransferase system component IIA